MNGHEGQWGNIVRALRNLEERKVGFEETWGILYEACVGRNEPAVGLVLRRDLHWAYTMVDPT